MSLANNLTGKTLSNRYEILRPLGEGGMGKVYLAKDKRFGKQVVVKVPTMEVGDKDFKDRFMREIASLATLEHAHIVTTVDWGEIEGIPFLVLRYLSGGSLRDRITDAQGYYKPMPLEGLNQWLPQIASALDFIHTKNWVHRDLKPDNILFDEAGNSYLADFGIAKALEGAPMGVKTTMGAFIGTPQYMAPEMHLGKGIGPRADQFGLAVLVYEALAGKIPFAGTTPTAIFVEVMQGKAMPIHELVPGIPLEKSNALMKGITKEPRDRYGSCVEFANAITGSMLARGSSSAGSETPSRVVIPKTRMETPKKSDIPGTRIETPSKPEIAGTRLETPKKADIPGTRIETSSKPEIAGTRLETPLNKGSKPDVRLRSEDYLTRSGLGLEQLCKDLVEAGKVTKELFLETRKFCKNNDITGIPGGVLLTEKIESTVKAGHVTKEISQEIISLAREILGLGKPVIAGTKMDTSSNPEITGARVEKPAKSTSNPAIAETKIERNLILEKKVPIGDNVNINFVLVPAGSFMMGSPQSEEGRHDNETQHEVTITKAFYMGKYEVTQEQWEAVRGNNPSMFKGANLPVTNLSWNDCQLFIKMLNRQTNGEYRLPTEAEWEYSCRGGTRTAYSFGDNITETDASYNDSKIGKPVAVGSYKPNAFGLYDMHGNVFEWCADWNGDYPAGAVADPRGPATEKYRVLRGGSFYTDGSAARSSGRIVHSQALRSPFFGFRLASAADIKTVVAAPILPKSDPAVVMHAIGNILVAPFTESKAKEVQKAIAKSLQKEVEEKVNLGNEVIVDLVLIPAGTFLMGSPMAEEGRRDMETQHEVTLTKPYYMGKYAVTQEQFETVMGNNPSRTKGARLPVTHVSWEDCKKFIKKLNGITQSKYRLPTEAEWEYACRAGTTTAYSFGDEITSEDANYDDSNIMGKIVAVGSFKANAFGLYDMHGNVREWCEDWFWSYSEESGTDPKGPITGSGRVTRGGSYCFGELIVRSSCRLNAFLPTDRSYDCGFRLVRTP